MGRKRKSNNTSNFPKRTKRAKTALKVWKNRKMRIENTKSTLLETQLHERFAPGPSTVITDCNPENCVESTTNLDKPDDDYDNSVDSNDNKNLCLLHESSSNVLDDSLSSVDFDLAMKRPSLTFKTEEDSDIKITEHDIQNIVENVDSKFENSFNNIDNSDQSVFQVNMEETDAIRLSSNYVNTKFSTWPSENSRSSNINIPLAIAKQAIQKSGKRIVKNAVTTFTKQLAHNWSDSTQEVNNIINTVQLCVLCGKDLSKYRAKKSLTKFLEMILIVTGIDITQYKISPYSCGVCYSSLLAIKRFQKKVTDSKMLIWKTLSCLTENEKTQEFEFANIDTIDDARELLSVPNINDRTNTEQNADHKMVLTDIQNNDVAVINTIQPTPEITSSNNIIENGIESAANKSVNRGSIINTPTFPTTESNIEEGNNSCSYNKNNKFKNKSIKITCSVCGKLYNKINYSKHMKIHKAGCVVCKVCGKQLIHSSIKSHMRNHEQQQQQQTPSDKFICSKCGKSYNLLSSLRRHEVTHGEKKYLCRLCNLSFHFRKYLERHMRSHSGEKPYACSYCDKTFSIVWNFHQHLRLHTNSKPYKCQLCSASFRHNVTLKGHLASAHTANEFASSKLNNSLNNLQTTDLTNAKHANNESDSNSAVAAESH